MKLFFLAFLSLYFLYLLFVSLFLRLKVYLIYQAYLLVFISFFISLYFLKISFTKINSSYLIYETNKDLEIRPFTLFNFIWLLYLTALFDCCDSLMLLFFFLNNHLYFLTCAAIAQIFNISVNNSCTNIYYRSKIKIGNTSNDCKN